MRILSLLLGFLLSPSIFGCLPGGILGSSSSSCGCSSCPCPAQSTQQQQQPTVYSYSYNQPPQQVYVQPVVPVAAASSSYQGQYPINPAYVGKAPLGFSTDDVAPINPYKYIEHVSVSHSEVEPAPPPPPPATIPIDSNGAQIQVSPSASAAEDEYSPEPEKKKLTTYYNQYCVGEEIATGEKETFGSADAKCQLLNCVAANAVTDGKGTYKVTFLKTATNRTNKKGNYCLSSISLPIKSKRVIRKFDDMVAAEHSSRLSQFFDRRF